jgi:hypothetical protein
MVQSRVAVYEFSGAELKFWGLFRYQYHLDKSVSEVQSSVNKKYSAEIEKLENICNEAKRELAIAYKNAPLLSRLSDFFGTETEYYKTNIRPYESDILVVVRALQDLYLRRRIELKAAEKEGELNYLEARENRRQETEAREKRKAQRKHERRVRYLEESPALRSAARVLKQLLIEEQSRDGEWVICYYCDSTIPVNESHLEVGFNGSTQHMR